MWSSLLSAENLAKAVSRITAGAGVYAPDEGTDEHVHREALEGERREAEIARHRHLEDLQVLHDRHRIVPLGSRPEVPELPEDAAQQAAPRQVDDPFAREPLDAEAGVDRLAQKAEPEPHRG